MFKTMSKIAEMSLVLLVTIMALIAGMHALEKQLSRAAYYEKV